MGYQTPSFSILIVFQSDADIDRATAQIDALNDSGLPAGLTVEDQVERLVSDSRVDFTLPIADFGECIPVKRNGICNAKVRFLPRAQRFSLEDREAVP